MKNWIPKIDQELLQLFWYFMNERHRIYVKYKVNNEPWPWTDDEILQKYKFTNIYREFDYGTIWLRENWLEPYADHDELFFNICMYRQFNWYPTADYVGFMYADGDIVGMKADKGIWNVEQVEGDLLHRQEVEGEKIFTGAHMLTGTIKGPDGENLPKVIQVVRYILQPLWEQRRELEPSEGETLEQVYYRMLEQNGFGPFLSYEVVTDLRHTRFLRNAPDIMTWANPGPGAMRGANRLLGIYSKSKNRQMTDEKYIDFMRFLLVMALNMHDKVEDHIFQYRPADQNGPEMRTIEHSLCEFDKYCRIKAGGRGRSRFRPPHERL